jgi:hypothetical protein
LLHLPPQSLPVPPVARQIGVIHRDHAPWGDEQGKVVPYVP